MKLFPFLWLSLFVRANDDLRCMNFYGLETERMDFVCSWVHPPLYYLNILQTDMKINTIRVPISHDFIETHNYEKLDEFVTHCNQLGLKIILDWHRHSRSHQAIRPDAEGVSISHFMKDWIYLLTRYEHDDSVFGVGIFNEIQHESLQYVLDMDTDLINTIEMLFPGRFRYFAGCTEWGGNCMGMEALLSLRMNDRIYIEVHKYIFSRPNTWQAWNISIPQAVPASQWFVGEMGWKQSQPEEVQWAHEFIDYLKMRNIRNACAWTIAHSGDTDGWWKDDCQTFEHEKSGLFQEIWNSK